MNHAFKIILHPEQRRQSDREIRNPMNNDLKTAGILQLTLFSGVLIQQGVASVVAQSDATKGRFLVKSCLLSSYFYAVLVTSLP